MSGIKRFLYAFMGQLSPKKCTSFKVNKKNENILFIGLLGISFISFFTIIINIRENKNIITIASIILLIAFLISAILIKFSKYKRSGVGLFMIAILITFTYYFFDGGAEGISSIWLIIIPVTIMNCVNITIGFYSSLYFGIIILLFCWTPLSTYTDNMVIAIQHRLPVWYFFSCLVGIINWYHTYAEERDRNLLIEQQDNMIKEAKQENMELLMKAIISISNIIDAKDNYTKEHSSRVAEYSKLLAEELGWNSDRVDDVYMSGLIHDIGKVGIPIAILNKPGKLNDDEYSKIQTHTEIGYKIIKDLVNEEVAMGVYCHHERVDGKGYPRGIKNIPEFGRVIAIADAFDAMNSNRVYRKSLSESYILEQLINNKGTQFDPEYVEAFLKLINDGKVSFNIEVIPSKKNVKKA